MSRRVLRWTGAALAVGSAIAMTAYSLTVGAEHADPLVRALGAFTGLAGLALVAATADRHDRRDGGS
ncbi:hypothetical protein AB0K60_01755 [Thermopolyspora sp. NPDC052614]|uniref:hypothetical protein n=1 Tax=Thermopolyspora sp. NPDC052614 TaxID=3155682 RepID=UPI0034303A67